MKKLLVTGIFAAVTVLAAQVASAISFSYGSTPSGTSTLTFDDLTPGTSGTFNYGAVSVNVTPNGQVAQIPDLSGVYAAPFGDSTPYLSTGTSSVSISFGSAQNYVGLLWGSVDNYNTLEFWSNGVFLGSVTGVDILNPANGNQGVAGTKYANIFTDISFDTIVAKSSQFAFEFDNVTYRTPDGGTTAALLGATVAGIAFFRRKFAR